MKRLLVALAVLAGSLTLPPAAVAGIGDLDPSFGSGGILLNLADNNLDYREMALDSQGRIVVVAGDSAGGDIHLFRYLPGGQPDPSFSGDGRITYGSGGANWSPTDVAIDSQDRIVVGGVNPLLVARFTTDGSQDSTFPITDSVTFGSSARLEDVLVDSADRVLIAGDEGATNNDDGLMVARLTWNIVDGVVLDTTFATTGADGFETVELGVGDVDDRSEEATIDSQDRIVVVGSAEPTSSGDEDVGIARFAANGEVDATFSPDGLDGSDQIEISSAVDDGATDVVTDATDRPVLSASIAAGSGIAGVVRMTAAGVPDSSFSNDGVATYVYANVAGDANAVAVDALGRILLAGQVNAPGTDRPFGVLRIDGSTALPDTTFSGDGTAIYQFDPRPDFDDAAQDLALDASGRILVGGSSSNFGIADHIGLARLSVTPDAPPAGPPSPAAAPCSTLKGKARKRCLCRQKKSKKKRKKCLKRLKGRRP